MSFKDPSPLKREFYNRNTIKVAKELLGKIIVRDVNNGHMLSQIVEVEAYTSGIKDRASHAWKHRTKRNKNMFGKNGVSYVYLSYGMYFMFNIVAKEQEEDAGAVLVRAVEPMIGIEQMKINRKVIKETELTSGPGKLTQALIIDKKLNGKDLTKKGELYIANGKSEMEKIATSPRIGISDFCPKCNSKLIIGEEMVENKPKSKILCYICNNSLSKSMLATKKQWRFYLKDNYFVSKHKFNAI